ncbi:hypothetical protein [Streptomyces soliscabiei]|uniref:hypothetical protein n=1 Tax=Streptomyces soliscabiei TaxID=588897 RepID=UPI0029B3F48B|nr:hypothetical protein [Streptomyces sp. NY05-11A]MDX2678460.1 hypothetical protein [Streptomyces sp. NY05-11A]
MGEVIARLAMSLDGYVAGPESGREHPLGIGGERLHSWVFGLRTFRRMQGEHIEWQKTQVLDSPGVTHIRLRAPHTVAAE